MQFIGFIKCPECKGKANLYRTKTTLKWHYYHIKCESCKTIIKGQIISVWDMQKRLSYDKQSNLHEFIP